MKKTKFHYLNPIAALLLIGCLYTNLALACEEGRECPDPAAALISFSKSVNTRCRALSISQAQTLVESGRSIEGFKEAYGASCDFEDSYSAAVNLHVAKNFADVILFSRHHDTRCRELTPRQALTVVKSGRSVEGFKEAYGASCDFDSSYSAARYRSPEPPAQDGKPSVVSPAI